MAFSGMVPMKRYTLFLQSWFGYACGDPDEQLHPGAQKPF